MTRRLLGVFSVLVIFFASTLPASAGCKGGTYATFQNNTKYCVWATLYYSYQFQAGWKIEHAAEVVPNGGIWRPWVAFNYIDLGPQLGFRAEVMNYTKTPCKGSPNIADLRENDTIPRVKINDVWNLSPRKATITENGGKFNMSVGLGEYYQGDGRCGI